MASYNCTELENIVAGWRRQNTDLAVGEAESNAISCFTGGTEMLRVAQDGFYIRGQKVPADDKEAETVYNAFKEFLVWSRLHRE